MSGKELALKIRELRAMHGLTLEQVAQQVGVGKSTVRKWETGQIANMRRDKIAKLAAALHTTPGYLMGWDNEIEPTESINSNAEAKSNIVHAIGRDGKTHKKILTDKGYEALIALLDALEDVPDGT